MKKKPATDNQPSLIRVDRQPFARGLGLHFSAFNYRALKGRGLQMETLFDFAKSSYLRVRVVECTRASQCDALQPHISRTVRIRMGRMAARLANKAVSRLPVCLLRVTALTARLAGKSRVNPQQRNASAGALVSQKGTQLCERPTVQLCPLALLSPDPRSNASEFFNGDHPICAFGERDYASRNCVIGVGCETRLLATALLQEPASRLRSYALELFAKCAVAMANLVQFCAAIFVSIRISRYFSDTKVDPQNVHGLDLFVFGNVHCDVQKPLSLAENQVGLAARIGKQSTLLLTAHKGHLGATAKRPDTNRRRNQIQRQNARVVGDAAVLAEDALNLLVQLVGVHNLCVEQTHDLSGQRKLIANLPIVGLVEREAAKFLRVPSKLGQAVRRAVDRLQRGAQSVCLFGRWQQFNLDSQFHFN